MPPKSSAFIQEGPWIYGVQERTLQGLGYFEAFILNTETQEIETRAAHTEAKAYRYANELFKKHTAKGTDK